jgi:hypothetical protein
MLRSAIDIGLGDRAGELVPLETIGISTSARVVCEEKSIDSSTGNEVGPISFINDLTEGACGEQDTE